MSIEAAGLGSGNMQGIWPRKGKRAASNVANMMLNELDADDDGQLSLTESGLSETAFKGLDTDGDGDISRKELKAGLRSRRDQLMAMLEQGPDAGDDETGVTQSGAAGSPASSFAASILTKRDADGSGSLSKDESGLQASAFDAFDTNKDGTLSAEELSTGIDQMFESMRALREMLGDGEKTGMGSMQRAVAAYKGQMGELLKGLFESQAATGATTATTTGNASGDAVATSETTTTTGATTITTTV